MRLFVAIVPPAGVLAELAAAIQPLQATAPELRWTASAGWHVTLAFLGEVDDAVIPELTARLERAAQRHPEQRLAIAGSGAFPRLARATVLWAGIRADNRVLASLAASVAAGARRAGAPPPDDGRKYRPHVTLARSSQPANLASLTTALAGFASAEWTAQAVQLVRSHGGGSAKPRYEYLAAWPLATGATRRS
jgi:RNA 2',3'-cyclic 3'-phosphodiesterase